MNQNIVREIAKSRMEKLVGQYNSATKEAEKTEIGVNAILFLNSISNNKEEIEAFYKVFYLSKIKVTLH